MQLTQTFSEKKSTTSHFFFFLRKKDQLLFDTRLNPSLVLELTLILRNAARPRNWQMDLHGIGMRKLKGFPWRAHQSLVD